MSDIDDIQQTNIERVMRDGPGLRYGQQHFVLARQPSMGRVLLGGLGVMGVGKMWSTEDETTPELAGYDEAEIIGAGVNTNPSAEDTIEQAIETMKMLNAWREQ